MKHGALAARAWPGIAVVAIGLAALLVVVTVDAAPSGSDAAQTQAGWAAYAAHCAVCHGVTLAGGTGPALDRSGLHQRYPRALDLYRYIKERMPLEGVGPGGLSDAEYLAITAAILDKRGVPQDGALNRATAAGILLAPTTLAPAAAPVPTLPVGSTPPPTGVAATSVLTPAASGNTPPQAPTLLEPAAPVRWLGPSPFFVSMHTSAFADADPDDRHTATEFEIRRLDRYTPVWVATVTSEPLDQATLERGAFVGPLAGRMGLKHATVYVARARHRDASGDPLSEWSAWSAPTQFRTIPQDGAYPRPMRVRDIQPHGLRWETADGAPVALGAGSALLITGVARELQQITGASRDSAIRDFPPAERYVSVFLRFEAGPAGLEVPESTLSFLDATGVRRFVWLPWLKLDPGAVLIGAPSYAGAFYFEPNDSLTGRADTEPEFFPFSRGRSPAMPWRVIDGFRIELVAGGFTLPVQMAAVPAPADEPGAPVAYITELYGSVKALGNDGSVWTYARNILDERPSSPISRLAGETGTSGIAVDPQSGDVYVTTTYRVGENLHNKIVRLESDDGGRTAARAVDVLRMDGEVTSASHQIHGLLFGHDGYLYVAVGDGFERERAGDDTYFGGKVLRLQRDGRAPADNPNFDPAHPDAPVSYQWAKGFRNIFAIAQRLGDDAVYVVENGEDIDRLVRVEAGRDLGWPFDHLNRGQRGMLFFGPPGTGPVGMDFANGGVFPADRQGNLYQATHGQPLSEGPLDAGKEIWEIQFDEAGAVARPPVMFVKYVGDGFASITGVAYLADGLYFLDFFNDHPPEDDPAAAGARLWRVVPDAS